jgi:hypothetical protein
MVRRYIITDTGLDLTQHRVRTSGSMPFRWLVTEEGLPAYVGQTPPHLVAGYLDPSGDITRSLLGEDAGRWDVLAGQLVVTVAAATGISEDTLRGALCRDSTLPTLAGSL